MVQWPVYSQKFTGQRRRRGGGGGGREGGSISANRELRLRSLLWLDNSFNIYILLLRFSAMSLSIQYHVASRSDEVNCNVHETVLTDIYGDNL